MAYSKDLRLKVLAAVDRGQSQSAVARAFGISTKSVYRFIKRREQSGNVEAHKTGPRGPMKLTPADDQVMLHRVRLKPGITATELMPLLSVEVALSTVCRRLTRLGLSLKKSP